MKTGSRTPASIIPPERVAVRASTGPGEGAQVLVEACVTSVDEAVGAVEAGAHRLELCRELDTGGLTPSPDVLRAVRAAVAVPVFAMARPVAGPFAVGPRGAGSGTGAGLAPIGQVQEDIAALQDAGADGVVVGWLGPDGAVDEEATRACVEAAGALPVTFHRAFDRVPDPLAALRTLAELGVRRVLTAGGPGAARRHADGLSALVAASEGRVVILAGGRIRGDHVRDLVSHTGVGEVHARAEGIPGLVRALAGG